MVSVCGKVLCASRVLYPYAARVVASWPPSSTILPVPPEDLVRNPDLYFSGSPCNPLVIVMPASYVAFT